MKICTAQVCSTKVRAVQVDTGEVHSAEIGSVKGGLFLWVLLPPFIPPLYPLLEKCEVLLVWHEVLPVVKKTIFPYVQFCIIICYVGVKLLISVRIAVDRVS